MLGVNPLNDVWNDVTAALDNVPHEGIPPDTVNTCPVVSGVYFISKENEGSLMKPFPVLFNDVSEYQIQPALKAQLGVDAVVQVRIQSAARAVDVQTAAMQALWMVSWNSLFVIFCPCF